jgi:hypothetical protein
MNYVLKVFDNDEEVFSSNGGDFLLSTVRDRKGVFYKRIVLPITEKEYNELSELVRLHCYRCGYDWMKKYENMPKSCPKCKNIRWNIPKRSTLNIYKLTNNGTFSKQGKEGTRVKITMKKRFGLEKGEATNILKKRRAGEFIFKVSEGVKEVG